MAEIKFLSDVSFYNKDLIYPETNYAYKVVDGDIYAVSLDDAICGSDGEETIINGHAWWNQKSDLFNWEKVTDWSTHKPKRQLASSWADKHIIIDLLKKIYNKTNFNNE